MYTTYVQIVLFVIFEIIFVASITLYVIINRKNLLSKENNVKIQVDIYRLNKLKRVHFALVLCLY